MQTKLFPKLDSLKILPQKEMDDSNQGAGDCISTVILLLSSITERPEHSVQSRMQPLLTEEGHHGSMSTCASYFRLGLACYCGNGPIVSEHEYMRMKRTSLVSQWNSGGWDGSPPVTHLILRAPWRSMWGGSNSSCCRRAAVWGKLIYHHSKHKVAILLLSVNSLTPFVFFFFRWLAAWRVMCEEGLLHLDISWPPQG